MIYIQSDREKKLPHHFDCSCALYGAIDSGLDYRLVSFEEVESGKLDSLIRSNLFVGSVEFMRLVFSRIGLKDVKLPNNSNRSFEIKTLDEAYKISATGKKIFIKPLEIKLFTGLVLEGFQYSSLSSLPEDTKVMVYDVFNYKIESEYRIYVHRNKIIDSRNYSGDFMITPNYFYVNSIVYQNKGIFPCSYTIDIGILEDKENVVIEFNDMWAIGNYGIQNDQYLKLLRDRYFEIVKLIN